jgi:cytochrome c-type biogenesis protein CcmH/NrfG
VGGAGQGRASAAPERYFDRLRGELSAYGEGVHLVGGPATEVALADATRRWGRALPAAYVDLMRSWNGLELFQESYTLFGVGRDAVGGDSIAQTAARHAGVAESPRLAGALLVGRAASGELFWLGTDGSPDGATAEGPVYEQEEPSDADDDGVRLDESAPLPWIVGSGFEPFLYALLAGHRVLVDREGEYRETVFEGDGELTLSAELKRLRRSLKADPGSAASWHRLGKRLVAALDSGVAPRGAAEEAIDALRRATELDSAQPWGWYDLGQGLARLGAVDESLAAFREASRCCPAREQSSYFAAVGALVASDAGRGKEAADFRGRALELDPAIGRHQRDAGQAELEAGRPREALERLSIARAVVPTDLQTLALLAKAKSAG